MKLEGSTGSTGEDENDFDDVERPTIKRTRRKLIKSCAFCRKRKLRCDHRKPTCSTCAQRGFATCIYPTYDIKDQLYSAEPPYVASTEEELKRKIADLEEQLRAAGIPKKEPARAPNPLRDFCWLQTKRSGRRIVYGPTTTRTFVMKTNNWGFVQLWEKVKVSRDELKKRTGHSMLRENSLVDTPFAETETTETPVSMVKETCAALPSYETILKTILFFFRDEALFDFKGILDERKVLNDFKTGFIAGPPHPLTSERPIVDLVPSAKKNYYKIGVILGIMQVVYYHVEAPTEIVRFLVFLTGLSTAKAMYVERIQMLLLRHFYRSIFSNCPDASHSLILVNSLIQQAMQMGLNRPIKTLFESQEHEVGSLESLENLWCWVMVADFEAAFNGGYCLQVTPEQIYDDGFFDDDSKTPCGLLKRFLKMVRPMLCSLYGKYKPDLEAHGEQIINFIETELPPIRLLTEDKRLGAYTTTEQRVLGYLLSMKLSFYGMRFAAYGEVSTFLKSSILQTAMITFTVCLNLLVFAHEQDMKECLKLMQENTKELGPYMCRAVSIVAKLLARAFSMFYGIAYYKLTLFESGLMIAQPHLETERVDLKTLRTKPEAVVSLMDAFESFREMFDGLLSDRQFKMNVVRSRMLSVLFAMERVGRVIIDKVLEYRASAEDAWIAQFQNDLNPADPDLLSPPDHDMELPPAAPYNTGVKRRTATDGAELISEDFWANYNIGLEEFMSNQEYRHLFSDFMSCD